MLKFLFILAAFGSLAATTGFAQRQTPFVSALNKPPEPDKFIEVDWQPQVLMPLFKVDKIYRFIAKTDVTMSPQGEYPRRVRIEQQARFNTEARAGGGRGVAMRALTERLQVTIDTGGKTLQYDSIADDNDKSVLGRHFESKVNRYVRMELNAEMKLISHREAGRVGEPTQLTGLPAFGPEELIQLVNIIPQGFSPDPVILGEEWTLKGKRPVGELGELGFDIVYKLSGVVKHRKIPCAAIDYWGQINGDINSAETKTQVNFQGSRILGRMLFDTKIKMIRHNKSSLDMVVHIADKEIPGKTKPVSMQQNMELRLLSVK